MAAEQLEQRGISGYCCLRTLTASTQGAYERGAERGPWPLPACVTCGPSATATKHCLTWVSNLSQAHLFGQTQYAPGLPALSGGRMDVRG